MSGRPRLSWIGAVLCWVCLAGGPSAASAEPLGGVPSMDPHGFVGFPSTRMPGPFHVDASTALGYGHAPPRGLTGDAPSLDHRLDLSLRGALGLGGRGVLRLWLPTVPLARGPGAGPGLADGALGAQVRVFGAPTPASGRTPEGGAVALDARTSLPFGRARTRAHHPRPQLGLGVTADMRAFNVVAGVRASYERQLGDPAPGLGSDRVALALGSQVPVPLLSRTMPERLAEHLVLDLRVATDPLRFFARDRTSVEGRGMFRWRLSDWVWSLGCSVGLLRAADTPLVRAFASLGYSPRPRDADQDGVQDGEDTCPELAEDVDGFEDGDGCPEPDNDGDGILDEDDRCPLVPADYALDRDEDGCNDRE